MEQFNFSFFGICGWGIDLDYCHIAWFVLETNRDYSVVFETEPKYCILDSFVTMRATPLDFPFFFIYILCAIYKSIFYNYW